MERDRIRKQLLTTLSLLLLLIFEGCGGGTVGTGTGERSVRSIEGRILLVSGAPLPDAEVTILETGESGTTDSSGTFMIETESVDAQISLEIQTETISSRVQVETDPSDPVTQVNLEVDPVRQVTTVRNISVTAKIEGSCDPYFENKRTIRQSNKLASNTKCMVNVRIRGDGAPLNRIPFVVEHAACNQKKWHRDSEGITNTGGFGTTPFTYVDEPDHCYYRIIVPYNVQGLDPVTFLVVTFQAQKN